MGRPLVVFAVGVLVVAGAIGGAVALRPTGAGGVRTASVQQEIRGQASTPVVSATPEATPVATLRPSAAPSPSPSPPVQQSAGPTATPAHIPASGAPAHFATLPPGSVLPSDAQCAAWVRAKPFPENKGVNKPFNQVTGHRLGANFFNGDTRANTQIAARVDGNFAGSTQEILRWTACKWGIDEDIVYAQAAKESWWQQTNKGDFGGDPAGCAPGHGLGADGQADQCPQSFGILQNRYPYEQSSWPGIATSTAMNADTAYAVWRNCFEGYESWLNTVEHTGTYAAGDAWGCVGRWFAGRWHTGPADQYMGAVQDYQRQRVWTQDNFQQP